MNLHLPSMFAVNAGLTFRGEEKNCEKLGSCPRAIITTHWDSNNAIIVCTLFMIFTFYRNNAELPAFLMTVPSMPIASTVHEYESITCGFPLSIPFHPFINSLVSNISCPHRLKTRKYFNSLILAGNGTNISFLPSPLGVNALGTKISGAWLPVYSSITFTRIVSTVRQPVLDLNKMVYSVVLS